MINWRNWIRFHLWLVVILSLSVTTLLPTYQPVFAQEQEVSSEEVKDPLRTFSVFLPIIETGGAAQATSVTVTDTGSSITNSEWITATSILTEPIAADETPLVESVQAASACIMNLPGQLLLNPGQMFWNFYTISDLAFATYLLQTNGSGLMNFTVQAYPGITMGVHSGFVGTGADLLVSFVVPPTALPGNTFQPVIRVTTLAGQLVCSVSINVTVINNDTTLGVAYNAHVAQLGWLPVVFNGATAGTTGQSRPMEALRVRLHNALPGMQIRYRARVRDLGWLPWAFDDGIAGTVGQSRQAEAFQIRLVGAPIGMGVEYRAHVQGLGWLNWVSNGATAGSGTRRVEAIEIRIVP
ncbi:MAG: hypothetical protein ACOYNY_40295 [Caldilineaceae bacterium]